MLPPEYKLATIGHLTDHLLTFPMKDTEKQNEKDVIKQILHNNEYDTAILNKVIRETTKK
jgi:hypothetical protein